MTPKHVMHTALVASLMTSFLVACAPSKNPKAKGLKAGTHKTAPASKKQLSAALRKAGLPPVTKADEEFSKRLLGASAEVAISESKVEKDKDGKAVEEIKASVTVKAIVLNKEGKEEVVIASGGVDEINKAFKIGAVNGCGEDAKYDVEVSCSMDACKALTVAVFDKGQADAKIPMIFVGTKTDDVVSYELSTINEDDKKETVRTSVEGAFQTLEAGKLTCADASKSTDALTAKIEGAAVQKQEDVKTEDQAATKQAEQVKSAEQAQGERIVVSDAEVEGAQPAAATQAK